jgi:hypothetical protein
MSAFSRTVTSVAAACLSAILTGCRSPATPSTSVVSGKQVAPANSTQLSYYSQPISLVVTPGVATGSASPTTTVEVAIDPAFTNLVTTQAVSPNASGQVTLLLDHLNPATTYYWRVKTTASNNPGVTSQSESFSIGPLLVFQPPTPVQPLADTFPHKRPTFVVTNAARTGPPATVTYWFDVATDAAFSSVVATATVPEAPTQTSFTPSVDLTSGTTYFWRAQARDTTKNVIGGYSRAQVFMTVNPDDGTFRYTLRLHLVSATKCSTSYGSPIDPYPGKLADTAFDAALVVRGDQLRYAVSQDTFKSLIFDIGRTGSQLSGTLSGDLYWLGAVAPYGVTFSFTASGMVENLTGRMTGNGHGGFADNGFPNYIQCDAEIAFELTPHP